LALVCFDVLGGSTSRRTPVSTQNRAVIHSTGACSTSAVPCAPPSGTSSCWGRPPVAGRAGRHAWKT
jgi:hypothetical protein